MSRKTSQNKRETGTYSQWKKFIVPVIALAFASTNIFLTQTSDMSRWRGGGMGMYTEIHWSKREIWFQNVPMKLDLVNIYSKDMDKIRRNPTKRNIRKACNKISRQQSLNNFNLEIWEPEFNNSDKTFRKKKIIEYNHK